MNNKDKFTISISVLALIVSVVTLYFTYFQEPDIDFECGLKMEIFCTNKDLIGPDTIDVNLPFSFVNKSNQPGSILDVKINLYPEDKRKIHAFIGINSGIKCRKEIRKTI